MAWSNIGRPDIEATAQADAAADVVVGDAVALGEGGRHRAPEVAVAGGLGRRVWRDDHAQPIGS